MQSTPQWLAVGGVVSSTAAHGIAGDVDISSTTGGGWRSHLHAAAQGNCGRGIQLNNGWHWAVFSAPWRQMETVSDAVKSVASTSGRCSRL
eukprot:CAMPEP_0117684738 /NCGR_PEP_ID=MMETSP0804-20121206/21292_1 /TAXON_ID=1074897 /ORGANISM="Tetraselmis astigmatica, Strain CCMP880" /LENGTH=90 /DNA_ID=CAMNT_0005495815 /DNA_START=1 /DNA_END=270 /DNA_ORIENTATION=-